MARSYLIFFLPILLSLALLADAARSNLLPDLRGQENNEGDTVTLQDAFEQKPLPLLPSESENQMMEVPESVRRPVKKIRGPVETHNRFGASAGRRDGESDSIFRPTEGEGDSVSPLTEGESNSIFLGRGEGGGRKDMRFGRPGAGCHHHHHGDEMKFEHFRGHHPRFPPHFLISFIFTSPEHEKEFRPRDEKEKHKHGMHQRPYENERFGFEPLERVFERRSDFPEREHTHSHGHGQWEPEFWNGKDFPVREHTQFEHIEEGFAEREHTHSHGHGHGQWEREFRFGKDFPEREHTLFEHTGEGFPERENTHGHHGHGHGHGHLMREFRNEERQEHGRHERQEDQAAPWTDWLRSLLPRH